jgi:hypothetical protein
MVWRGLIMSRQDIDHIKTNIRSIVLDLGNYWIATHKAFSILSGSVYPRETVERRLGGEPQSDESGDQEAINLDPPEEWKHQGGARIVAGHIKAQARHIIGSDWLVVILRLSHDQGERQSAIDDLKGRLAKATGSPEQYAAAVCNRWNEKKRKKDCEFMLSREYKIEHMHCIADLVAMHHMSRDNERITRSDIYTILDNAFDDAKRRLRDA